MTNLDVIFSLLEVVDVKMTKARRKNYKFFNLARHEDVTF